MKKIKSLILTLLLLLLISVSAQAGIISNKICAYSTKNVEAVQMEEGNVLKLKTVDEYKLTEDTSVEKGSVLTVRVKEYIPPKRGKINGYLKIYVDSYTIPSENNKEIDVTDKNIAGSLKIKTNIDKQEVAEMAGLTAAEYALDATGLSQVYAATKGLVKPNEGESRLKSMGTNLYNSTGLQYIKKGEDMVIKEDTLLEISIK